MEPSEDEFKRGHKYPFVSCELLNCDVPKLLDFFTLTESQRIQKERKSSNTDSDFGATNSKDNWLDKNINKKFDENPEDKINENIEDNQKENNKETEESVPAIITDKNEKENSDDKENIKEEKIQGMI